MHDEHLNEADHWLQYERAHPLKEGVSVGRYQIGSVIGADAISVSYAALDSSQGRRIVLREFLPCMISRRDPDGSVRAAFPDCEAAFGWARDSYLREGQAQLRVHHPALSPVTALQTIGGSCFLASVPVEGKSLSAVIAANGKLGADDFQDLATPLLEGLRAIHSVDQDHAGLTPDGILVTVDGAPLLPPVARAAVDLATGLELDDTADSPWSPPEHLVTDGTAFSGPQSDIYGLAASLYLAATGRAPAPAIHRLRAMETGDIDPYEPVEIHADGALPAVVAAAVNQAMSLDPKTRPETASAWKDLFHIRPQTRAVVEAAAAPVEHLDEAFAPPPAKLETAIAPPMPAVQSELPLAAAVTVEARPQEKRAEMTGAPDETLVVRPRRAAAAVASATSVAASIRSGQPERRALTGLVGAFGAKVGAPVKNGWQAVRSIPIRAVAALKNLFGAAVRPIGRLVQIVRSDRRVQAGTAGLVILLLLSGLAIWMLSGPASPDGPNVASLKKAEERSATATKTPDRRAQDTDAVARREAAKRKAAEEAAAKQKVERRQALAAAWRESQTLTGDERVAAEKDYFVRAFAEYGAEAKAWHDKAVASHRDGDFAKALGLYRKAADVGHPAAQTSLGYLFIKGQGVEANPKSAALWFRRAAERGNRVAQSNLAGQYTTGRGLSRDFEAARRWALAAAAQGDPAAHGRLGYLYRYGLGVDKNARRALAWYRKGAKLNHTWSMAEIGAMYEAGDGVKRNAKMAARWYRRARRNGSQYAERRLNALRKVKQK